MRWISVAALALAVACGGSSRVDDDRDGGGDGGRDGGAEPLPTGPILERSATLTHDCTGALGITHEFGKITGRAYVATDDAAFGVSLVSAATVAQWFPTDDISLQVAPVAEDGSLGAPAVVGIGEGERTNLSATALGDTLLAVWVEDGELMSATFASDGTVRSGPHALHDLDTTFGALEVVATGDQSALVFWGKLSGGVTGVTQLFVLAVDQDGRASGAPRVAIDLGARFAPPRPAFVEVDGGAVYLYAKPTEGGGTMHFGRLDASGAAVGDEVQIAEVGPRFLGFAFDRVALLPQGDGFLAAWADSSPAETIDGEAWTMVELARLDADGAVVDGPHVLTPPVVDIDYVEPALFTYGDAVALTWGRGDHIYVCAGCVPNHDVELVLFDPVRLAPVSEVARILAAPTGGGLLRRRHVVSGAHIATSFEVTFHVTDRYAEGTLSCAAR